MNLMRVLVVGLLTAVVGFNVCAADMPLQTRVSWLPNCPSDPQVTSSESNKIALLGALVTAIAPKLIEGVVDAAAEALKAAGQSKTAATTARSAASFYAINQDADLTVAVTCLVIVRGTFDESKLSALTWARSTTEFRSLQRPVIQLEIKVAPLRSLKYFQLIPQYLKIEDFEETRFFDRNNRDYSIAVTFTVPGAAQAFGAAEFSFKDISKGTEFRNADWRLRSAASLPIAFPPESVDAARSRTRREAEIAPFLLALDILSPPKPKSFSKVPSIYEDRNVEAKAASFCAGIRSLNGNLARSFQLNDERCAYPIEKAREELDGAFDTGSRSAARRNWAQIVCQFKPGDDAAGTSPSCANRSEDMSLKGATFTYFTTQLTLSETREGSKFALFLGNALSAAKTDVNTVLKQKLMPRTQSQTDTEDVAGRIARTALVLADLEVIKAEEVLGDTLLDDSPKAGTVTTARIALVKAKIEANKAYRKAGLPIPYPDLA